MQSTTVSLQPTRTHKCRMCSWTQVRDTLGVLEIHEGRTPDRMKVTGRYLCQEVEPTYCRRFQVTKELATGGEVYWVSLATGEEGSDSCDCTGFESHGHCKHSDGLRALANANLLCPSASLAV